MNIKCKKCGKTEKFDKAKWATIIGGAAPIGLGFWAWTGFIFAGTGLAMPIVIAMMTGGVGIFVFQDKIVKWLSSKYDCPKCGEKSWDLIAD